MKKIFFFIILIIAFSSLFAQAGLKAGINFSNVSNASSINAGNKTGFSFGGFFSSRKRGKFLGFRTELIYSRQGYNYRSAINNGKVNLEYILLPQLTTLNITKYLQLQAGGQIAFLLNANVDSSKFISNSGAIGKLLDIYHRLDYGFAAGFELHPYKCLFIGARYNISFGNLYNSTGKTSGLSFIPLLNTKNNLVNLFAGWKFGKR